MAHEYISLGELIQACTAMVEEIRSNSNAATYTKLIDDINELQNIDLTLINKNSSIGTLLKAYKQIIAVSIDFRQLLINYDIEVAQYNSISYAIYYQEQIQYAEDLKPEWLSVTKRGLMLNLRNASEALQESLKNDINAEAKAKILELLSNHYSLFLSYIEGMYRQQNKHEFGDSGSHINRGHVAEAHERHLQETHISIYNAAKVSNIEMLGSIEGQIKEMEQLNNQKNWHENAEKAWQHVRDSLGFQRGTVAGDVNGVQVKQVKKDSTSSSLRLSSFQNLRRGIQSYSDLLNPEVSASIVGARMAIYMADPMEAKMGILLNKDLNNLIFRKDSELEEALDRLMAKAYNIQISI